MAQMILNREVIGGVASDASKVNYKNSTVEDALDGVKSDVSSLATSVSSNTSAISSLNSTILNKFDSGQATIPSISSGSIGHFAVQFSHTFNSTPRVVISQNESQANLYRTGLNISVSNINTSGFNIYYAYNGSAEIGPTLVDWIAIS